MKLYIFLSNQVWGKAGIVMTLVFSFLFGEAVLGKILYSFGNK